MISIMIIVTGIVIAAFPSLSIPLRRRITTLHGLIKRSLQFVFAGIRIASVLLIIGVVTKQPLFLSLALSISMFLFTLVFIIPGLIMKIIGAEEKIFPSSIKIIILCLILLSFLGVLPGIIRYF